ncbi:MAG: DUF6364 family protein [Algoriphagus sp.]|uniref:DUF6364 family protein n=1 Tax=Algoriphagus sp. TaxID=1872435 RepID=UPI00261DAE3C|nr:DUF6364 family protein [Algoriphagus sp.]MDG1277752.1 DUF6364 family protein [Algoriphagus sp.]
MDSKITLAFDSKVIAKAKAFAKQNQISLSRLTEYIYSQLTSGEFKGLEDLPIADWIDQVAEGEAEYIRTTDKNSSKKKEFFESRK